VADLTQDLLTYSKEREPEIEPCFPNEIVDDVVDLVSNTASTSNIKVSKETDTNIGQIDVDPQTIHRTLLNLVNNAMDACVEDENTSKIFEIHIKTYLESKNMLCLEVSDNGCGMDKETQARLFDPMFSTKGGKGTGLGLLVTGKLVEEHKGSIDINTRLGQGTTFIVRLPYGKADVVDRN
jgi:two-component system NtrC family sensor kinase